MLKCVYKMLTKPGENIFDAFRCIFYCLRHIIVADIMQAIAMMMMIIIIVINVPQTTSVVCAFRPTDMYSMSADFF